MNKHIKYFTSFFAFAILAFTSCKKEDKTFGDLTAPDKPVITVAVAGKTATSPNGDGSGKVTVTVTSANAINYKIDFGDGSPATTSTVNTQERTYFHVGVKDVTITAIASGKGGLSSSSSVVVSIKKDYTPSAALVTMLTNDASKTWMVDSVQLGHLGVGPVASYTADWWQAPPNDKAGQGIYDDEYTFTKTGNVFTHKTNNSIFGKKEYLIDFNPALTGSGDFTLTGSTAANYTEGFAYSGGPSSPYESIIFSSKGHLGLYVGSHVFDVLTKSATQMWLRCVGKDGNAWYVRIKAK